MKIKSDSMKKLVSSCALFFSVVLSSHALNVTIIESTSINAGHTMDGVWFNVATSMGHTASIQPQATLDNNLFFATTDILIVASGVINLPANRIATIQQFIQTGKSAYLQTEYDCANFTTNSAYATIVNALGGNFTWNGIISGTLAPMNVLGSLANTNNIIPPLTYFWYGCRGTGCAAIEYFLEFQGNYFGFIFCPPNTSYGRLITTSDQDWVRVGTSLPLMENIIDNLAAASYQCNAINSVSLNLGNDTTLCVGQQLTLNAQNSGATYLWSTGATSQTITVSTSGNYWVNVTVSGCLITDTINVTFSSTGNLNLGNDTALCVGSQLTLNAQNAGATFLWSTGATSQTITVNTSGNYWVFVSNSGCNSSDTINVTFAPSPLVSAQTQQDVLCNGGSTGSATVTITSGTSPYTYLWSPTGGNGSAANNLSAGTYTVIITDAIGCTTSQSFTIIEPTAIAVTASSTATTCGLNNGAATSGASGGTGTYSYHWNPSGGNNSSTFGLASGTYTVIVTDGNGCTTTATVSVAGSTGVTVSLAALQNLLCNGDNNGSISVNASGTPPYTYSWSPSVGNSATVSNLSAGMYTVAVTDSIGCSQSLFASISEPSAIILSLSSINTDCILQNGETNVNASGGTPAYSYLWNNGQMTSLNTALDSGTYTVTVTDMNGCIASDTVSVGININIVYTISNDTTIRLGASTPLIVTGGSSYTWSPGNSLSCDTCPDPVASPSETTTYCVQITDSFGCSIDVCMRVYVEFPCGEVFVPNAFSPNGDYTNDLECVFGNCIAAMQFSIYDRWGEKVFETSDVKKCWDGMHNGELLNTAVFVYYLDATLFTGEHVTKKGNVSLIR